MHPLSDNLKTISFEELEKRSSEIFKRMQIMRRAQIHNAEMWSQLEMLLDSIQQEKMERAMLLNSNITEDSVVVSTDPLEDEIKKDVKPARTGFNPIT